MASSSDLVRNAAPNFATTLSAPIVGAGDSTMTLSTTTGLPTGTGITLTIDATDANGNPTPTIKETVTGVVGASNTITNLVRGVDGTTAQAHSTGASVIQWFTANDWNDFQTSYLSQHNQNGSHGAITATSLTTTGAASIGGSLSSGNFSPTGAFTPVGSWDAWIGANESWTYASATTITVPTDATTKYDIGDWIKFTQSATVKYFIVTGVAATVLTVAGLAGATVANSSITANAYSKARNPHGNGLNGGIPFNPYKFFAYATATQNLSGTISKMHFETEDYDTGGNYDSVTNFRFTVPLAGYYRFSAQIWIQSVSDQNNCELYLFKNGSSYMSNFETASGSSDLVPHIATPPIFLATNDYIEIFATNTMGTRNYLGFTAIGFRGAWFGGELVSVL